MIWRFGNRREDGKEVPANMAGKDLDTLARELAEQPISRGRAMKLLGATLFGGVLTALVPGVAFARPECHTADDCLAANPTATSCRCVNASGGKTCVCQFPGSPPCCPKGTFITSDQCNGTCCAPFKPNARGKCVGGG
jgi:hypothetical protein